MFYLLIIILFNFNYVSGLDSLKNILTELQYEVTQNCGTEPPFDNLYWNNKEEGIYLDLISNQPLFFSFHKYKSGTGWPSFYDIIDSSTVEKKYDYKLGYNRIEIKSKVSSSHLGHLFYDGPNPTGLRYCINSASLKFIKLEDFDKNGLSFYKKYFSN